MNSQKSSASGQAWWLLLLLLPVLAACPRACKEGEDKAQAPTAAGNQPANPGTLAGVTEHGRLRVLMTQTGGRALPRSGSPLGEERDLLARLAEELGVELEIIHPPSFKDLLPWLEQGRGDLVAASMVITPDRQEQVAFTIPVDHVRQVLVGPADAAPITSAAELDGKVVVVSPGSTFDDTLQALRVEVPGLDVKAADDRLSTQSLLEMVGRKEIPYTVSNSGLAAAVAGYSRDVKVLFELTEPRPIGWALRKGSSHLLARVNAFLSRQAMTAHREESYQVDLDGVLQRKVLRVLTRNNGVTYFLHRGREVGFEYELVRAFAEQLGVRLEVIVPPKRSDLIPWLRQGRGDLVAAMLTVTDGRAEDVMFGAPYASSAEVVVTRAGGVAVDTPAALAGKRVHVRAKSAYRKTLEALSATLPQPIEIVPVEGFIETEEMLRRLADGSYDITVAYSNIAQAEARFEPKLVIGPELDEARPIAWAVRKTSPGLKAAVDAFFTKGDYKPRGLMYNILAKRYLKLEASSPEEQAAAKLGGGAISPFDPLVRKHAGDYQIDWRLVAAQMYQESRFDPAAVSPVGALGLMQVMPATARGLGVGDVRVPEHGIHAGVKYMRYLFDRFPAELSFQSRYHFTLASYNAGKGHVDDARRLAAELDLDPDLWSDNTEKAMLLLEKTKYAKQARYGYCRGREPVRYVEQIQSRFQGYSELVKE